MRKKNWCGILENLFAQLFHLIQIDGCGLNNRKDGVASVLCYAIIHLGDWVGFFLVVLRISFSFLLFFKSMFRTQWFRLRVDRFSILHSSTDKDSLWLVKFSSFLSNQPKVAD